MTIDHQSTAKLLAPRSLSPEERGTVRLLRGLPEDELRQVIRLAASFSRPLGAPVDPR